ncbi:hypothetical protein [Salinibacterium sp. NK8237]|uniref:hypothetical protein n=1 Tax=Salinibacterium sp. NK8237 TaxID=2792038 RepID=UPI0018CDA516|nr:hypothetical protein [Salinibacterium sp. NK8237]MBH0131423.1 hypothetical protein [Salinibacterium sp. NK8237]
MFRPVPRQPTMIDSERGFSWRSLGATERGLVEIAALTINGVEIPYEYRVEERRDEPAPWYDIEIGSFGSSIAGQVQRGLTKHRWASDTEREGAVLIAIEATLAWFPGGRGVARGDGNMRATFGGRQYRLSDFGPYFGCPA